jgi:aspartate carbamoyltransferase catalytic subunit
MHADMFVVRHSESGAPYLIARHCAPHVHVVNAGDGRHSHPTQGLLDTYTIRHYKKDFTQLTVAIVGYRPFARRPLRHPCPDDLGVPEIRAVGPRPWCRATWGWACASATTWPSNPRRRRDHHPAPAE